MAEPQVHGPVFRRVLVLALVVGFSTAFFAVVSDYIIPVFVAAIFSTVLHPAYRRILPRCGGRKGVASGIVLFGFVPGIIFGITNPAVVEGLQALAR